MKNNNYIWGVALIILGVLFLLQAIGYITDVFGWFWPILIILFGISILVGPTMVKIGWQTGETFSIDLQGATQMDLRLEHGAGSVSINGDAAAGVAAAGSKAVGLEMENHLDGDKLKVKLEAGPTFVPFIGPAGGEWQFSVSREIPVSMKIDAGASNIDLDMSEVKLVFLKVDTGASTLQVKLPANAGYTLVEVESGAASIDLSVPENVGARIRTEQGASSIDLDQKRFLPMEGLRNVYQSANYSEAANQVEITLKGGANSIKLR